VTCHAWTRRGAASPGRPRSGDAAAARVVAGTAAAGWAAARTRVAGEWRMTFERARSGGRAARRWPPRAATGSWCGRRRGATRAAAAAAALIDRAGTLRELVDAVREAASRRAPAARTWARWRRARGGGVRLVGGTVSLTPLGSGRVEQVCRRRLSSPSPTPPNGRGAAPSPVGEGWGGAVRLALTAVGRYLSSPPQPLPTGRGFLLRRLRTLATAAPVAHGARCLGAAAMARRRRRRPRRPRPRPPAACGSR